MNFGKTKLTTLLYTRKKNKRLINNLFAILNKVKLQKNIVIRIKLIYFYCQYFRKLAITCEH